MKRSYRSDRYLKILENVRAKIPNAAITTDIIVGFPGETEEDFQATIDVVRKSRFAMAYTFQYSKRPGTPAAEMPNQIEKEVVQERYERLLEVVNEVAWQENQKQIGREVEVLVANGEGRKDSNTNRMTGRARDNRLVHFEVPAGEQSPRPGDLVNVQISRAAPYFLIADSVADSKFELRRTAGGDASDRAAAESCSTGKVNLGIPIRAKRV
jgi:tRNA-2-methylthio-N6-dimethylallyladenosine synthase